MSPLLLSIVLSITFILFVIFPSQRSSSGHSFAPLAGSLYKDGMVLLSSDVATMTGDPGRSMPKLDVYIDESIELGFGKSVTAFFVNIVDRPVANFKIVPINALETNPTGLGSIAVSSTALTIVADSEPKKPLIPIKNKKRPTLLKLTPVAVAHPPALPVQTEAPSAPPETEGMSYRELDQIIQETPTAYTTGLRYKKGDIVFGVYNLCKWKNFYLIKCKIRNDEKRDFFISTVNVSVNGDQLYIHLAMPYSCPPAEELSGIIQVEGRRLEGNKKIRIELKESGGAYRRFPIEVEYSF